MRISAFLFNRTGFYSPERLSISRSGVLYSEYDVRVGEAGGGSRVTLPEESATYRGPKRPRPWDHQRALGIGLL